MPQGLKKIKAKLDTSAKRKTISRILIDQCTLISLWLLENYFQLCQQVDAISTCSLRACEENNASALRSMLQLMCARKVQFEKHVICLASVATSEQVTSIIPPTFSNSFSSCSYSSLLCRVSVLNFLNISIFFKMSLPFQKKIFFIFF